MAGAGGEKKLMFGRGRRKDAKKTTVTTTEQPAKPNKDTRAMVLNGFLWDFIWLGRPNFRLSSRGVTIYPAMDCGARIVSVIVRETTLRPSVCQRVARGL